jgi:hypothetical protein
VAISRVEHLRARARFDRLSKAIGKPRLYQDLAVEEDPTAQRQNVNIA